MTWQARWGRELAEGNDRQVWCSDLRVEREANDLLLAGVMFWTPTGPVAEVPSEAATWLAFVTAVHTVTAQAGEGAPMFTKLVGIPEAPAERAVAGRVY